MENASVWYKDNGSSYWKKTVECVPIYKEEAQELWSLFLGDDECCIVTSKFFSHRLAIS
jgi:hypothetical protein